MKLDVEDEDEAAQYLEEDFIQEFGISQIIIRSLSKIDESEYPGEKKIFCSAIQRWSQKIKKRIKTIAYTLTVNSAAVFSTPVLRIQFGGVAKFVAPHVGGR